jgi:hypothetical protein
MSTSLNTMTDFKQLCAELVAAWDDLPWQYNWRGDLTGIDGCPPDDSAVERARAALAEPEPEGPTDAELLELAEEWPCTTGERHDLPGCPEVPLFSVFKDELIEFARAVLVRWGNHPGSPDSSTPQPVPEPVAWMYQGEPSFDGTDWQETWEVTTDKRLAEFKATPDQPIPLFCNLPQPS